MASPPIPEVLLLKRSFCNTTQQFLSYAHFVSNPVIRINLDVKVVFCVKKVFYKYYMLCIYHVPGICNLCLTTVWTAATLATYINGLPQNLSLSLPNWKIVSLKNSLLKILNVFLSVCYTQFLKSLGSHSRKLW